MSGIDDLLAPVAGLRVLALDDNRTNTELVRRVLQRAGLPHVVELQDPTLLDQHLQDVEPDLVLLDLRMPALDGFAALDVIRARAAGEYLPVIVVTADAARASVERALSLGAHDFLTKPFDPTELVLRVRNLLLTRSAYKELRRSRASLRSRLGAFDPFADDDRWDTDETRQLLLKVIREDDIAIALQPIVDLGGGPAQAWEALARFPDGPLGGPAGWFAAALRLGLMAELELAAARRALTLLDSRPDGTALSLNFSPSTIITHGDRIFGPHVALDRVVIELTEHTPVEDYPALNAALRPLRDRGARVAVDDAGAGFASLRHVLDLHPDVLKIDIGIVRGVDSDPSRAAVVAMLVHFALSTGMSVVAEGVETEGERAALRELGAVLGQGYLLGRPEVVLEAGSTRASGAR